MVSSLREVGAVENQELLLAVLSRDYRDYVQLSSGGYNAPWFLMIDVDGSSLSTYDRQ